MILASFGMALLTRIAASPWVFGLVGAVLSWLIATGWVVQGATAAGWPRLRSGQVLIAAGLAAVLINLVSRAWLDLAWSSLVALVGAGFTFRPPWLARVRRGSSPRMPGPVRPPLTRREEV